MIKAASRSKVFTPNPLEVPGKFEDFAAQCRIRSGTKIIPFHLYDWQQELSAIADQYSFTAVKTRQLGVTELLACKMLHKASLSPAYSGAVLSLGGKATSRVAERVRRMPSAVDGFRFSTNAVTDLRVAGGGNLIFAPSTDNAVRSLESTHDLLFDEASFVPNIEEIYSSATPSQEMVGDAARTYVISTISPEGKLSWFWRDMLAGSNGNIDVEERLARAKEGVEPFQWWIDENGWAKVIIHWKIHPIYSLISDYLEKTRREKKLTEEKLQREYNLGLPDKGGSLFQANLISKQAQGSWKPPANGRKYLAGLDPNFGGSDFFTLQIWDITERPYQLVRQYRSNSGATVAYHEAFVKIILKQYKPVITAVEINTGGKIVLENLIRDCSDLRFEAVLTSTASKPVNTDRIAVALESLDVIYPPDWEGCSEHQSASGEMVSGELYNFSALSRAATVGNDDTVMAWAIAFSKLEEAIAV